MDGPTHFLPGSREATPHTALKRWLIAREGYTVVSVPYFDWAALASSSPSTSTHHHHDGGGGGGGRGPPDAYRDYLARRLSEVGWHFASQSLRRPPHGGPGPGGAHEGGGEEEISLPDDAAAALSAPPPPPES